MECGDHRTHVFIRCIAISQTPSFPCHRRSARNSETCEITALTVPTPLNQQRAVSMYSADDARARSLPYNRYDRARIGRRSRNTYHKSNNPKLVPFLTHSSHSHFLVVSRATELLVACGHSISGGPSPARTAIGAAPPGGVCGDAFVGRCHDDENADVWERVDFDIEDANPRAGWCDVARRPGGGGSSSAGGGGSRSLSGLMNQNAVIANGAANDGGGGDGDGGFREGKANGYTWLQNDEEVEMRFPVSAGTKAKYVKISFGTTQLRVVVAGQTLASGSLGGTVEVDDSTFTIEDANGGTGKELCVTLGKKEGNTWPFILR